jgi:hypothetical protein
MQPKPVKSITLLYIAFAIFIATGIGALIYFRPVRCNAASGGSGCLHILFIGNSYTYVNDLPTIFTRLAKSGGHPVETGMVASGGWTLEQHAGSSGTLDKISSEKWDFVVLQEQSVIPAIEGSRASSMYPAARALVGQVRDAGATPLFFLTWAHRDGDPAFGLPDAASMQAQLETGYDQIGQELDVQVVPAGTAWIAAIQESPQLNLWQDDGSHPTQQGTYLAACVFYATIYNQSPEGLSYTGQLPKDIAQALQAIAARVAFNTP